MTLDNIYSRYPQVKESLLNHMAFATHLIGDRHSLDYNAETNWNFLRDIAKEAFSLKQISALDGSGVINEILS